MDSYNGVKKDSSFFKSATLLLSAEDGIYLDSRLVNIEKIILNDLHTIKISLDENESYSHVLNVYLEKMDWNNLNIQSGKYEILFLKEVLFLNNLENNEKFAFKVENENGRILMDKLPKDYKSLEFTDVIGIAFYSDNILHLTNRGLRIGLTAVEPADTCKYAGGEGSTSCSNKCCSVTCSAGYYSECFDICYCVKPRE